MCRCRRTPTIELCSGSAAGASEDREDSVLSFSSDVYIVSGTGVLIPVDPTVVSPEAALYNAAGAALGITWGRFSGASATAATKVSTHHSDTRTDVQLRLSGLIPQ